MSIKKVTIIAGSKIKKLKKYITENQNNNNIFIGSDYGCLEIIKNNLPLHYALGDFDSLTKKQFRLIKTKCENIKIFPKEKNETDTFLALKFAIENFPNSQYDILGATGGRLDHFFANFFMIYSFKEKSEQIKIRNKKNEISFFTEGEHKIEYQTKYKYFSLICLNDVKNLNIQYAKYNLQNLHRASNKTFISNQFQNQKDVDFSFTNGIVALILSKD